MQYDSYKDSGEQWLGQIPSHWEMLAIRYILQPQHKVVGKQANEYALLSLTLNGVIKRDMDNPTGKFPTTFDTYQEVNPDDFIFCMFDNEETPRAVGLSRYRGMITGAYDVMQNINALVNNRFLEYYFLDIDNFKKLKPLYKGLRKTVPLDSFKAMKIAIPPLPEQERMVAYLDKETAAIDAAIAQQQKMIDLLNERKQIIIQQAVTKGLDPNAKMKDSGIDWIGQIPEGWEVKKLKHCFCTSESGIWGEDEKNDGEDKICVRVADFDYEKGCIKENNLTLRHYGKDFTEQKRLKHRDLLLEKSGGGDLYPVGRVVRYSLPDDHIATCSNFIQKLTPFEDVDYNFLYYVFRTMYFAKVNGLFYNQTTGIQNLKVKEYLNQNIYLPVLQEQQNIVRYLEGVASELERHVDVCHSQISLLRERKQIIINEVVTGKIKV